MAAMQNFCDGCIMEMLTLIPYYFNSELIKMYTVDKPLALTIETFSYFMNLVDSNESCASWVLSLCSLHCVNDNATLNLGGLSGILQKQ